MSLIHNDSKTHIFKSNSKLYLYEVQKSCQNFQINYWPKIPNSYPNSYPHKQYQRAKYFTKFYEIYFTL